MGTYYRRCKRHGNPRVQIKKEAYEKAETDPAIKDFLGRIFWDNLENNIEAKVEFYKLIKQKL